MKAVSTSYYRGFEEHLVHTNVVEMPKVCANREFKCLHCGKQWTEHINSPQIISEEVERNFKDYFDGVVTNCLEVK